MDSAREILERMKEAFQVSLFKEIADKLDVKANTIDTWKQRNRIPDRYIYKCMHLTGFEEQYIRYGRKTEENNTVNGNNSAIITGSHNNLNSNNSSENTKEKEVLIKIPYFENTYASAGGGSLNYEEQSKPMAFSPAFLKSLLGISTFTNLHIINAIGNSMDPTIKEGELLFVNPFENESNNIKDGGVYVITFEDHVFVKRVDHNPITKDIRLISDNKDYSDIAIGGQEFDKCKIIGRVVGHFSSL